MSRARRSTTQEAAPTGPGTVPLDSLRITFRAINRFLGTTEDLEITGADLRTLLAWFAGVCPAGKVDLFVEHDDAIEAMLRLVTLCSDLGALGSIHNPGRTMQALSDMAADASARLCARDAGALTNVVVHIDAEATR